MRDLNPTIEVESARGNTGDRIKNPTFHGQKDFPDRRDQCRDANAFLSEILFLEQEPTKPVTIYINSPAEK